MIFGKEGVRMGSRKTYNLDMVSVRLVHDPPLLSDHKIKTSRRCGAGNWRTSWGDGSGSDLYY